MNEQAEFVSTFRARLESLLQAFATLIAARVPGIVWRVELPPSRVYDMVAVLTFMDRGDRQSELVTVSLETQNLQGGTWTMDVTDRESLPLELDGEPTTGSTAIDMSSVDAAAGDIDGRLQSWRERIVRELKP